MGAVSIAWLFCGRLGVMSGQRSPRDRAQARLDAPADRLKSVLFDLYVVLSKPRRRSGNRDAVMNCGLKAV